MTKQIKRGKSAMEKLGEYKMEILNRCLESQVLAKLLKYDSEDALSKKDIEMDDAFSLMNTRVFPYRFVPTTIDEQGTFLTLGVNGFRRYQEGFTVFDDYQAGEIYFYFFTHVDIMRTDNGVRQDLMLAEISRLFDGTKGIGMGELKLRYLNELWIHNNKFGGYAVSFTVTDFK
ncbi:hypothetical protein [Bacillus cereus]|nr:hypothetical protein [Bacillus cereus]